MTTALAAGVVGLALGAVMARGTVCFNAGVRKSVDARDFSILRIFAFAVAVQLLALPILVALGVSPLERMAEGGGLALVPVAQVAGGLVFGIGMALAGGCIAGILWKTGAGSIATAIAIAGFAAGELLAQGALSGTVESLTEASQPDERGLANLLGISYEALALALGVGLLGLLLRGARQGFEVGAALGAVAALAWVAADVADYGYGIGFVGAVEGTRESLAGNGDLPFQLFLALGVLGGAFAAIRGPLRIPDGARSRRALIGGVLMGLGGTTAGACNIGHGVAGLPLLSLGSALAIVAMAAGAAITWRFALGPRPGLRGSERPEPSW